MNGNGTFSVDPSIEIKIGDKVFIHMDDEDTYTGTITAPGEFTLDEFKGLSIGSFAPDRWPFGTIVENTKGTHTLMVISDEGDTFVAMQLKGSFVIGETGRVAPGWPKRRHVVVNTP